MEWRAGLKALVVIAGSSPGKITKSTLLISSRVTKDPSSQVKKGFPPTDLLFLLFSHLL